MKKILFILSLLLSLKAISETDTAQFKFFPKNYGEKEWRVLFSLDARRSFFNQQKIKLNGLKLGAEYKGVHRFGFGFYSLKDFIYINNVSVDEIDAQNPSTLKTHLSFVSIFYERVFFKTKHWEVAFPAMLGGGSLRAQYQNIYGNYAALDDTPFNVLGTGINAKYYIWGWLIPKASFGYRFVFNSNVPVKNAFQKPYYAYGVSISVGEIYRKVFKK